MNMTHDLQKRHKWSRYQSRPTNRVARVGMNYLSDLIIRPGIEKAFTPLLLYRGNMSRGHAHRYWNLALLMMAADAETFSDGLKIMNNEAFAQLCGPVKPPEKYSLYRFFCRLFDNPAVTRNIDGLTEYVRSMEPNPDCLNRVDRFSDRIDCAPWRISLHENAGQDYRDRERGIPKSQQLFYPFMVHNPEESDGARDMVLLVNRAVPDYWPEEVRADVCQEMIVGLLSGDIAVCDVHDAVQRYVLQHFQILPYKWEGPSVKISIDAPVFGTDDMPMTEVI